MKMKKMLAILAAMTMLGAVTGCGGDSGTSTPESSSKAESSESSAESSETSAESSEESSEESTEPAEEVPTPQYVDDTKDLTIPEGAITFDTPSLYGFHAMGGGGDEADVELQLVNLDGDTKLRVRPVREDATKDYGVPKIVVELPALLGLENVGNIGHISVDFTCVARDEWQNDDGSKSLVVGNFLGALAGNIASEKGVDDEGNLVQNTWANHMEFAFDDWVNYAHSWRAETKIPAALPANGYAANDEGTSLVIMRWGQKNSVDFYIDNVSFLDKDGKPIPIAYDAAANPADVIDDSVESAGKIADAAPEGGVPTADGAADAAESEAPAADSETEPQ